MKQRISITIDEKKMKLVEALLKEGSRFRNKSHFVESGLDKILKEETSVKNISNKATTKAEIKNDA